jgi:glycosyltransferase involved in cell wall biosynthesis
MPRVRVLQLIEHLQVGGAERLVADLVRSLDPARVQAVTCHYRTPGPLAAELEREGFRVVYLDKDIWTRRWGRAARAVLWPVVVAESVRFVLRLSRLVRDERIDVVHAHEFSAGLWGRIAGRLAGVRGIVTTEHTARRRESLKRTLATRLTAGMGDRVVAVSDQVAAAVRRQHPALAGRLAVIPNGVRLERLEGPAAAAPLAGPVAEALAGAGPRIAIVGRLVPEKRHDVLLEALARCRGLVPGLRCLVVGDGPLRGELERHAARLGLGDTAFFVGEQAAVAPLLGRLRLVVNSSEREGLPLSLLEAMGAGVPVVATDAGGTREIVRDGETGLLVPPLDPGALADAIVRSLTDPEGSARLAAAARRLVRERYSMEAAARRYEKLYAEVLAAKP